MKLLYQRNATENSNEILRWCESGPARSNLQFSLSYHKSWHLVTSRCDWRFRAGRACGSLNTAMRCSCRSRRAVHSARLLICSAPTRTTHVATLSVARARCPILHGEYSCHPLQDARNPSHDNWICPGGGTFLPPNRRPTESPWHCQTARSEPPREPVQAQILLVPSRVSCETLGWRFGNVLLMGGVFLCARTEPNQP